MGTINSFLLNRRWTFRGHVGDALTPVRWTIVHEYAGLERWADVLGPVHHARTREAAAAYICVSPNTFDEMVKNGQMPGARLLGSRRRGWDVRQLDIAIDQLPSDGNNTHVDETWSDVDAPKAAASR